MATTNSTSQISGSSEALEALSEASSIAEFVQGITDLAMGEDLHMPAGQVTGLYHTLQHLISRINFAENFIYEHEFTKKSEIAARTAELEGAQS